MSHPEQGARSPVETLTFGCRLNAVESEAMRTSALQAGETDLLIVNSCAVTADAVRQSLRAIRRAKRERPHARIVVTGCASEIERARFAEMPEVSRVVANADKLRRDVWAGGATRPDAPPRAETAPSPQAHTRSFIDVQSGCDHRCTFCVIPLGRGPSRSRPIEEIVARIQALVAAGRKEAVLTGVDLTAWGADLPGAPRLGRLARDILRGAPELARLRLSSLDCAELDAEFWAAFAEEERLMPHLHLSLQSGADLILKRMKRRHTRTQAIKACEDARRHRPEAALGADFIVGFPTETDAMFEDTLRLVDECGLTFLHVFPYSPRPGTPAARMPQLDPGAIRLRAARLRAKGEEALRQRLSAQIGRRLCVLAEAGGRGHAEDFTLVQLPPEAPRGAILDVLVTGASDRALTAVLLANRRRQAEPTCAAAAAP